MTKAIRACMTQDEYSNWWSSAPDNKFYEACCDKLLDLYHSPAWTKYTPSTKELSNRSYKNLHVPGHTCPRCGFVLEVNEKEFSTTNPDAPHYERRLVCPGFFVNGCRHHEPFTAEVQKTLDMPITPDEDQTW